jgi:hypothetical protein
MTFSAKHSVQLPYAVCQYTSEAGPSDTGLETTKLSIEMQQKPVACLIDSSDRAIAYTSLNGHAFLGRNTYDSRSCDGSLVDVVCSSECKPPDSCAVPPTRLKRRKPGDAINLIFVSSVRDSKDLGHCNDFDVRIACS